MKETKALLLSYGRIALKDFSVKPSKSKAGPGAGLKSVFFRFYNHRVKLEIDPRSPLIAKKKGEKIKIYLHEKEIVEGYIEEPVLHCPEQAYITVSESCIFNCLFCPMPKLKGRRKSEEKIVRMIKNVSDKINAISITSGVYKSLSEEVEYVAKIIRALEKFKLPIGVSICPTKGSSEILYEAGAREIKYNIEVFDRNLFDKICRGKDYHLILESLIDAVDLFGRNKVCSNIIVGLGENNESIKEGIDFLTSHGIVPILRPYYPHPSRKGEIKNERPSAERILELSAYLKNSLKKHNLDPSQIKTMCIPCGGCDITPLDF